MAFRVFQRRYKVHGCIVYLIPGGSFDTIGMALFLKASHAYHIFSSFFNIFAITDHSDLQTSISVGPQASISIPSWSVLVLCNRASLSSTCCVMRTRDFAID